MTAVYCGKAAVMDFYNNLNQYQNRWARWDITGQKKK